MLLLTRKSDSSSDNFGSICQCIRMYAGAAQFEHAPVLPQPIQQAHANRDSDDESLAEEWQPHGTSQHSWQQAVQAGVPLEVMNTRSAPSARAQCPDAQTAWQRCCVRVFSELHSRGCALPLAIRLTDLACTLLAFDGSVNM